MIYMPLMGMLCNIMTGVLLILAKILNVIAMYRYIIFSFRSFAKYVLVRRIMVHPTNKKTRFPNGGKRVVGMRRNIIEQTMYNENDSIVNVNFSDIYSRG